MKSAVWECEQSPDTLLEWLQGRMVGAKGVTGARRQSESILEITSESIPGWAIFLAIVLFPIGLIALMARNRHALLLRAEPKATGGSQLHLDGNISSGGMRRLVEVYNQLMATPVV
jgi:hypothetical protein